MKVEKGIQISVVMGSQSDWQTMQEACDLLEKLDVSFEKKIVSAHRTPDRLYDYANSLRKRRVKVVIAGAGGAAHLPGMIASKTNIPVIGVPISATDLRGVDSLYSIVQMPRGYPVATMAIGAPGAFNAAIFAIQILALSDKIISQKIQDWRNDITTRVKDAPE
ncbi:MAG: 5-(carboxyamino)imidazole ribonucleotide mutase [Rhodobacterales bacterium TMED271]|nr:MAG: 5-(carboxyamino)imidazole ribonucleotide mutase [Rhodobacterales bacterium TMED271]RCL76575.1 MAG: 5-(carboxyamino)imidazole ribonucleotide mutase [Alphaproteobacteria bacterium]|tara:strand:- start:1449 stop:1940 length:492 start_codon:yes stop_codon:yes gene_type:complete